MSKTIGVAIAAVGAFVATSAYAATCTNDVWKKVMSRGEVVVGVKADYKPWGYRDSSG